MARPDKTEIEVTLDQIHKRLCRATYLIVTMIVKRRLWRDHVSDAISETEVALQLMKKMISSR